MKKHWITVWMIVAIVACGGAFTFAKFDEGQNYAKRKKSAFPRSFIDS